MLMESLGTGLVIVLLFVGFIGTFVPLLPGALLIWLTILVYCVLTEFMVVSPGLFAIITMIALTTGTSSIWLSLLGAKTGGADKESILWGIGGAVAGFLIFNLLGAILGYAAGILYSEYRKHQSWNSALKASIGGLAGWGISTAMEAGGALVIIVLFMRQLLTLS